MARGPFLGLKHEARTRCLAYSGRWIASPASRHRVSLPATGSPSYSSSLRRRSSGLLRSPSSHCSRASSNLPHRPRTSVTNSSLSPASSISSLLSSLARRKSRAALPRHPTRSLHPFIVARPCGVEGGPSRVDALFAVLAQGRAAEENPRQLGISGVTRKLPVRIAAHEFRRPLRPLRYELRAIAAARTPLHPHVHGRGLRFRGPQVQVRRAHGVGGHERLLLARPAACGAAHFPGNAHGHDGPPPAGGMLASRKTRTALSPLPSTAMLRSGEARPGRHGARRPGDGNPHDKAPEIADPGTARTRWRRPTSARDKAQEIAVPGTVGHGTASRQLPRR